MKKNKRILVALSLSDGRDAAFERALALANAAGAELYLLHAIPANLPFSHRAAERLQRATELRERAEAAGVSALTVEQHGNPAEIIRLHADARAVDLIVMGTERRTGWARFRERSITEQVLRRAKRPTLVVRSDDTGDDPAFKSVLVAVDMSVASAALIETALQMSGGESQQLTVIHAVDGIEPAAAVHNHARWVVPEYRSYVLDAARQQLADVMPPGAGGDVRLHVAAGPPAETIGAYAADANADLIVMGRSKRFLQPGSTAVGVLRNTDRALLIVPPEASAQVIDREPSVYTRGVAAPIQEVIVSNRSLIIVPVDSSQATERTVQYAVSLAKQRGADVHVVQVVPRDGALWRAPEDETSLRARLRALRPAAEQEGVFVRIVTLRGVPERVIPAYAQLHAASLVVVGRHYASSRLWRSSAVASRLSRASPVPVLVAPTRRDATAPFSLKRIVAAVDFTVASAIALRAASDLSKRHGARLTMLHATAGPDHMVFSGGEVWRFVRRLRPAAKVLAERLKRQATTLGSGDAEPVVVTGDPSRGIVHTATMTAADLIVMGAAPRTWIDEMVSGSTVRRVLRRATAPVLVIPVVGGAHEWMDEVDADSVRRPSTADGMARHAA